MPQEPQTDWHTIRLDLPIPLRKMLRKAGKLAGLSEEEMVRAIMALSLVQK